MSHFFALTFQHVRHHNARLPLKVDLGRLIYSSAKNKDGLLFCLVCINLTPASHGAHGTSPVFLRNWKSRIFFFFWSVVIQLYTLPMNINRYVSFLILLCTLHMNINGYVQFLILLYIYCYIPNLITSVGISHSSYCYIPYLWTLMGMSHSFYCYIPNLKTSMGVSHFSYCYIPYLWTSMVCPIPHTVIYPTYEKLMFIKSTKYNTCQRREEGNRCQ